MGHFHNSKTPARYHWQLTERDCAAVHVDSLRRQPQQLLVDQVHHAEGLVDLPVVNIALGQPRTRKRLAAAVFPDR
jgi:hypothetical protein